MRTSFFWTALGGAGVLGVWFSFSWILGPSLVPHPQDILTRMLELALGENLVVQGLLTWLRSLGASLGALFLGTLLGNLLGRSRRMEDLGLIPLTILQGTPPLVWTVPLVILLFGARELVPLAVVFLVVLPLGIINVQNARKTLTPEKEAVFRIYSPDHRTLRWRELHLPHLVPALRSSLQLGLVLGLKSSIIGEWVAGQDGLGRLMNASYILFDLKTFLAVTVVFLTLVFLTGLGGSWLADRLLPLKRPSPRVPQEGAARSSPGLPAPPKSQGLEIRSGTYHYPRQQVFHTLNLTMAPGETLVLSGESGGGKTTLARLILGLIHLQGGEIRGPRRPGCLFQEDALLEHRDALGNVALPLWDRKVPHWQDLAQEYLAMVGLPDKAGSYPDELSGGQRKRLAFARALALNPGFMVLDEPFHNLHREARKELWELYWNLFPRRGLTSLIITHYPEELMGMEARFLDISELKTLTTR